MPTHFVVIGGRKGVGKSTAARLIADSLPKEDSRIIGFAHPIKEMAIRTFGLDPRLVWGTQEEKAQPSGWTWGDLTIDLRKKYDRYKTDPVTVREFLQILGSEVFRDHFSPDCWVKAVHASVSEAAVQGVKVVIAEDARLPGELICHPDKLIKTHRIIVKRPSVMTVDAHPTETALDNVDPLTYDWQINNVGDLSEYTDKVYRIVDHMDL